MYKEPTASVRIYVRIFCILSSHQSVAAGLDAQSVLQNFGKGKPIPAIIEAVSSGASLRATLLPDQYFVSVMLVGIVCPSFNRRPTGQSAAAPAANGTANGNAPAAAEPATNGTAGMTAQTSLAQSTANQDVDSQPTACLLW